jgi:hypothetical protein
MAGRLGGLKEGDWKLVVNARFRSAGKDLLQAVL